MWTIGNSLDNNAQKKLHPVRSNLVLLRLETKWTVNWFVFLLREKQKPFWVSLRTFNYFFPFFDVLIRVDRKYTDFKPGLKQLKNIIRNT